MYKVGDSVQCFSFNNWYDAKILSVSARMLPKAFNNKHIFLENAKYGRELYCSLQGLEQTIR